MTLKRMEHVGIVVEDMAAATEFFSELGLDPLGEMKVEGAWVDRINGLDGVQVDMAMMGAPDGSGRLEIVKYNSPPHEGDNQPALANRPGIRHIAFLVEDIEDTITRLRARGYDLVGELERYKNSYLLCYVRGPEGIIIELAEKIGDV